MPKRLVADYSRSWESLSKSANRSANALANPISQNFELLPSAEKLGESTAVRVAVAPIWRLDWETIDEKL